MNEKATIYDYARMCKSVKRLCSACPLKRLMLNGDPCSTILYSRADEANEIIIKWSKEHPVKTRQDKFLEMFQNAHIYTDGVLKIKPCYIDEGVKCDSYADCLVCRDKYWLAEVEE